MLKKKNRILLFCEGTSIRGMQKVLRARSRFLRMLWMSFVFIMSTVLFITSTFLVLDYLQYNTAWQVSTVLDARTAFPSLTLCSHNPFPIKANKEWEKGKVYSPTHFRRKLTDITAYVYEKNVAAALKFLPFYDRMTNYYAQLSTNQSISLGHTETDLIRFCMTKYTESNIVSNTCADNDLYLLRRLSIPQYFNCWTLEYNQTGENVLLDSQRTESHQMILSVTPSSDVHEMNNNFVMDVLSRGEGIRIVVHEPGTYPDIEKDGVNLQPGKMNEISFRTIQWHRLSTPKAPCRDQDDYIVDLDRSYRYTFGLCLDTALQNRSIEKCRCMSTMWPRPQLPSSEVPYCFYINASGGVSNLHALQQRLICADNVDRNGKKVRLEAEGKKCFRRCTSFTYETTMSVTDWTPSTTKLARLENAYRVYMTNPNFTTWKAVIPRILHDNISTDSERYGTLFKKNSRFIYFSVTRQSFDIQMKREHLVLDINILISRIGGLCSLCIGLTCAFFIEIIEFVYLFFRPENSPSGSPENNSDPYRGTVGLSSTTGAQPSAWYNTSRQETAYHFSTETPSHSIMLEADTPTMWSSPWRKMNNNHELTARRVDPSISCV